MPAFCCVVKCGSRRGRDPVRFFRIPAVLKNKNEIRKNELSFERRNKWLQAIKRADLHKINLDNARVCSKHFASGEPAKLEDVTNPDWVPSIEMGYGIVTSAAKGSKEKRYKRWSERSKLSDEVATNEDMQLKDDVPSDIDLEVEDIDPNSKSCQTDIDCHEIGDMFLKLHLHDKLKEKLSKSITSFESLKNDDSRTKYYTGLENYGVFVCVVNFVIPYIKTHGNTCLLPEDQVLLCLMKLRLNLDYKDLAYRFGISANSASHFFKKVLDIMFQVFQKLIIWPERNIILKTMPTCFKESFLEKACVIIDCFEIFTQTPSNLLTKAQCWSSYKHHQTVKYLIGISPQGFVCFISEGWGGRVSDKFLTVNSGFLNKLIPGDVIIADRGFLIKEFVNVFRADVKIPAFTKGKTQLHPVDLEKTRAIAHVRIHVERVIGVLRQKFRILSSTLPIYLLNTGEEPILDKIVFVCCALFNLCPPIIPL